MITETQECAIDVTDAIFTQMCNASPDPIDEKDIIYIKIAKENCVYSFYDAAFFAGLSLHHCQLCIGIVDPEFIDYTLLRQYPRCKVLIFK